MGEFPLLRALRAALPVARAEELPADVQEQALRQLIDDARRGWPGVEVADAAFVAYLAERALDGPLPGALHALHAADLYLACGCVCGDPAAIAAFQHTLVADLDERIVRAAVDRLDEVRQLVIEKALVSDGGPPRIVGYRGRGPLHAWVRVTAARIAIDLHRAKPVERSLAEASLDAVADGAADPELAHLKTTYRAELKHSIEVAAAQLSVRERNLLRHSLLDGLTIDDLAARYRVHRATAARWLVSAREALGAGTKRDLTARLGLRGEELISLMRVVESQLEISWSQFRR